MTPFVQAVTNVLSVGTVACDILVVLLFVIILTPLDEGGWGKKVTAFFGRHAVILSFLVAAGSVAGSLFYSEYAHFAPCELCWIQRGLLYTEAVILFLALFARKEEHVRKFHAWTQRACITLSAIGFPVAAYHVYLQLGGGAIVPCSAIGPSCQYVYFLQFGYVTIPTMSLTAFALILVFMLLRRPADTTI
ncbi:MAG TPA: disulfide bond formation protein B [Candidatus Paceibacterota bacterium]|nr:disulfide bond formation protein B [Candidatus Paceibacterota bacterium]